MGRAVISALFAGFLSLSLWAFPLLPLWTNPDNPAYLREIPEILEQAEKEILVALSDLRAYSDGTTDPLILGLCAAAKRGAAVYALLEDANPSPEREEAVNKLSACGVNVRNDSPDSTLHTKFLVVDTRFVVVGSTHWTKTALTRSIQVDLVFDEPSLAHVFRQFFFYLWEGKTRVKTELPPQPWPEPALIPVLDFPQTQITFSVAQELLGRAQSQICVALYSLTLYPAYFESPSNLLLQTLAEAATRGVRVQVILEGGEADDLSEQNRLSAAWLSVNGAEVRLDPSGITMHAKILLVDGKHVLVSSANWNYSSLAKNMEAGVALLGTPELAAFLEAYFTELWEKCSAVP
ncbi:hypothetical protein H5T57_01660 [Candidatus Bipolaricaulota bacterium]|nr:hypothetical protein [Candidatus Bipolaricaulota bacterium]